MLPVRVFFRKKGKLKYISHLDLMRAVTRGLMRSGLPIVYTEGFNPHPKLVFALPLSVGMAGENEMCDVGLLKDMDKAQLPPYLHRDLILTLRHLKMQDFGQYNHHKFPNPLQLPLPYLHFQFDILSAHLHREKSQRV